MRGRRLFRAALAAALLAAPVSLPVQANWLTALTKGAGKTAGHLHPNLGALERAAGHLAELPQGTKGALAAHATPEGHWQFANKDGQLFTAGTPDEMKRVAAALIPEGVPNGKLSLYLSEDSVFADRHVLDSLPKDAELHLVSEKGAFKILRGSDGALSAEIKPNVRIALSEKTAFDDAVNFLTKPLNKSSIRTLSLQPGEAKSLSSAPKLDPASKTPLVDVIDPDRLAAGLSSIRGQSALLVGRIEGEKIIFQPATGGEITRNLDELLTAARDSDVNLVLLHADTPRQPGGRNWLWQTIEIGGFSDAISKSNFADFIEVFAARRGPMQIMAAGEGSGRVRLSAVADAAGTVAEVQESLGEAVGNITGEIAMKALEVHARDEASDRELDARLIPGVPTYIQIPYFIGIFCGLIAWDTSRSWWRRIWAPRLRLEGEGRAVHWLKGLPNLLSYLLVYLPVAGYPAMLWHAAVQTWATMTAPIRWLRKILRRRAEV